MRAARPGQQGVSCPARQRVSASAFRDPLDKARRPAATIPQAADAAVSHPVTSLQLAPSLASAPSPHRPLHQCIREAATCQDVVQLVRGAQRCSVPDLTAAVHRVVRLYQAAERRLGTAGRGSRQLAADGAALRVLLALATSRLEQLDAWAAAQCLWAGAAMQQPLAEEEQQQAAWERRVAQLLASAQPQSVAIVIWAAAKLGWRLGSLLEDAAEAAVQRTARNMTAQDVANVLWAWANRDDSSSCAGSSSNGSSSSVSSSSRGWPPMSAAVAAALQQRLKRALPGANAQDVSNSLWALSRLGWRLEGELAAAAGAAAQRTAPLMGPQAVSNSLWAYGSRGWQLGDAAAAELRQRLVEVLPSSPPQAVANSLAAASRLGWRLDGRLAAAAEAALLRTLPHSTAEGVADALWAHGHARWQLGSPSQAAFADQLVRVLPRASPAQLGDVCKALGRLRWDPGADVVAAAAAAVQRLLEASLQCCTLAGAADAAALGAAAAAAAAARDVPAAAAASVVQPLRNLLWSLAELRLSPPERLTHLTTEWIAVQLGCCDDSQLSAVTQGGTQPAAVHVCDLLYCLARLGAEVDGDLLGAAVQRCLAGLDSDKAGDAAWLGSLIWACSTCGHALSAEDLARLVPPAVDAVCPAWQAGDRGAAGGGILLVDGLAQQPAGAAAAAAPAAAAALSRLLPLACADIQRAAAGEPLSEVATGRDTDCLSWLASWAGSLTALGLSLPPAAQAQLLSCVRRHGRGLRAVDREQLRRAFGAWGHEEGAALLEVLEAGACL